MSPASSDKTSLITGPILIAATFVIVVILCDQHIYGFIMDVITIIYYPRKQILTIRHACRIASLRAVVAKGCRPGEMSANCPWIMGSLMTLDWSNTTRGHYNWKWSNYCPDSGWDSNFNEAAAEEPAAIVRGFARAPSEISSSQHYEDRFGPFVSLSLMIGHFWRAPHDVTSRSRPRAYPKGIDAKK